MRHKKRGQNIPRPTTSSLKHIAPKCIAAEEGEGISVPLVNKALLAPAGGRVDTLKLP